MHTSRSWKNFIDEKSLLLCLIFSITHEVFLHVQKSMKLNFVATHLIQVDVNYLGWLFIKETNWIKSLLRLKVLYSNILIWKQLKIYCCIAD